MHIVIHTQYYPPEIGAPQTRLSAIAQGLRQRQCEVTVITAMPNYPTGRIYEGYGGLIRNEDNDNVRIIRTAIYPSQSARLLPRMMNYLSFVFSSILAGFIIKPADYLITESPPLFLGIAGYLLSRWKGARWIFNVSDLWPESAVRLGMLRNGIARRLGNYLESFCYQNAWVVTGQTQGILENIKKRFPNTITYLLSNGADVGRFHPNKRSAVGRQFLGGGPEQTIVLYAGLHGHAQGLDQVLFAAKRIQEYTQALIVFIGDGPEKSRLIQKAQSLDLRNVRFLDPISHEKIPELIASADICLVPLVTNLPGAVPSKLYEAMASAKPVILIAEGEPAEIVVENQAGFVVKPGDINGLVEVLNKLIDQPSLRQEFGTSGRRSVERKFNRTNINKQFIDYLIFNITSKSNG